MTVANERVEMMGFWLPGSLVRYSLGKDMSIKRLAVGTFRRALSCAPLAPVALWFACNSVEPSKCRASTPDGGTSATGLRASSSQKTNALDLSVLRKAEAGDASSQYLVGLAYAKGAFEGKTNETAALHWLREAAVSGYAPAQLELADRLQDSVYGHYGADAERLTEEQKEEVLKEALKWYRKAAEQGLSEAQFKLALALLNYASGVKYGWTRATGTEAEQAAAQLLTEAATWQRRAAEQGHAEAAFQVAMSYAEPGGGFAERYALGEIALRDVPEALRWCRKAAELGHVEAQFQLAVLLAVAARGTEGTNRIVLSHSWFVPQGDFGETNLIGLSEGAWATNRIVDPALESESWTWCRRAAEKTNVDAARRLALHCENGRDYVQAAKWWRMASHEGDIPATIHLADMYDRGEGALLQDHREAANLLLRIANDVTNFYTEVCLEENPSPLLKLGERFESGLGVPRDAVEAYKWFDLVAGRYYGFPCGEAVPKAAAQKRDALARRMTPEQTSEARARVTVYLARLPVGGDKGFIGDLEAAERGDAEAQRKVARRYEAGEPVRVPGGGLERMPNYIAAEKWWVRAASRGDADAQYEAGEFYLALLKKPDVAARYFRRAAEQGDARGQFWLGIYYSTTKAGQIPNNVQAYKWFRIALAAPDEPKPFHLLLPLDRDEIQSWIARVAADMTPQQVALAEQSRGSSSPKSAGQAVARGSRATARRPRRPRGLAFSSPTMAT